MAHREVAAAVLDDALGWGLVPPTVLRDGPWGPGSVQWWIDPPAGPDPVPRPVDLFAPDAVPTAWRSVLRGQDEAGARVALAHSDDPDLRRLAMFDVLANNADRKAGHVLVDGAGRIRGVDHGLTFHTEPKLRTVLWGWAGSPLPEEDLPALRALLDPLRPGGTTATRLGHLLGSDEVEQTRHRLTALLAAGRFPRPVPGTRAVPWPPV